MNFQSTKARIFLAAGVTAALLAAAGCGSKGGESKTASADGTSTQTADAPPIGPDPCTLVTVEEAKTVYPEVTVAKSVEPIPGDKTRTCEWKTASGDANFEIRLTPSKVSTELDEVEHEIGRPGKETTIPRETIGDVQLEVLDRKIYTGLQLSRAAGAIQKGEKTIVVVTSHISGDPKAVEGRLAKIAQIAAAKA